jgi:hypothetical protein
MTAQHQESSRVASRPLVPSSVAEAFIAGAAVDQKSRSAGYQAELAGAGPGCPAGIDMFSFFLGRAEARRYHGARR